MNKFLKSFLCAVSIFAISHSVDAVNVSWMTPTNNLDGTALTNLAGYNVYSGKISGNYSSTTDVGLVNSMSINNASLSGVVYFATSAYDSNGNEGPISDEFILNSYAANAPSITSVAYTVKNGLATISFSAPTKNTDGTSCSGQIRGYIVGYGKTPNNISFYTNFSSTGVVTKATLSIPTNSGTWYASIATTNQWGNIGPYSLESSFGTTAPNKVAKPKSDIIDLR